MRPIWIAKATISDFAASELLEKICKHILFEHLARQLVPSSNVRTASGSSQGNLTNELRSFD